MGRLNEPPPRPFLKWAGGKRQLLPELLSAVAAAKPFRRYHEPFLGGGALFFALARTGQLNKTSYLSDVNTSLIEAYLGVRHELEAVVNLLRAHKENHSEAHYYAVRGQIPHSLAERAARIIYLNRACYNGLYRENSKGLFNVPFGRYTNPTIVDEENLPAVSQALHSARIEKRDFAAVRQVAQSGDLVYFDPPYHPVSDTAYFTKYSRDDFDAGAQQELAKVFDLLAQRGVKVMLSNSMTEFTRRLYKDYRICQVWAPRWVNSRADRRGKVPEALITSFPIKEPLASEH
ncbi:MAG: DNA adenine methylase [Gammaproteobacteria bacterium]